MAFTRIKGTKTKMVKAVDGAKPHKKTRVSGAGVTSMDGYQQMSRKQILIDAESIKILTAVGKGNLSLGIREAARRLVDVDDAGAFSIDRHEKRDVR